MQNSPLLVTKASPVNNVNSSINQEPDKQPSDSFENVLSKRVKHHETQAQVPAVRNGHAGRESTSQGNASVKGDDKQNKTDVTVDDPVDSAEVLLQTLTDNGTVSDDTLENVVDAQALATDATNTILQDVTDGKVTLKAQQEAGALQVPLSSMMAPAQRATRQATTDTTSAADVDVLEQPVIETGKKAAADEKSELAGNRLQDKALQANPIKETSEKLSLKFANVLATESKQQASADSLIEPNSKVTADVAAMSLQATVAKPTLSTAPLQATGASNLINASPGKAGWNEAVGQKVVWMVGAAEQSATLTLNPKDLGPLQVIINVNNEKADATFISENPEVRKALEEGMSSLRNAMGQAGIELGQANVNTGKQQQAFQQANKEYAARQSNQNNAESGTEQLTNSVINTRVNNGLVDTFA